jgi:hypothetical protein
MKRKAFKSVLVVVLLIVFSCDEPKTIVTNIVHPDGSVTRKIEMRNNENKFELSSRQVPFDSTWAVKDTCEISDKGDTTWVKTAEKYFINAEEINKSYLADKGANKDISRKARFEKKFKWFNTLYRFSERVEKKLSNGYPVKDFLNPEELAYFYSPESVTSEKLGGKDSLKYKALNEAIGIKTETWLLKSMISEWIYEFSRLTSEKAGNDMTREALKAREDEFVKIAGGIDEKFDSLWTNGIILRKFIGENNAITYKTEADTALEVVTRNLFVNFKDYSVRIVMPGTIIGTNGFIDETDILLWPVKSDYFMTEEYEMWAESKVVNTWAWVVTGIFILFVITGLFVRLFGKRKE